MTDGPAVLPVWADRCLCHPADALVFPYVNPSSLKFLHPQAAAAAGREGGGGWGIVLSPDDGWSEAAWSRRGADAVRSAAHRQSLSTSSQCREAGTPTTGPCHAARLRAGQGGDVPGGTQGTKHAPAVGQAQRLAAGSSGACPCPRGAAGALGTDRHPRGHRGFGGGAGGGWGLTAPTDSSRSQVSQPLPQAPVQLRADRIALAFEWTAGPGWLQRPRACCIVVLHPPCLWGGRWFLSVHLRVCLTTGYLDGAGPSPGHRPEQPPRGEEPSLRNGW